ncbi:DnaB-like helicase N-terminal domain-containing protein [Bacillus sp. JJ1773]|uniref:DnaB-like helicase N-terminal domain-containing protein n=1 Tax=Bacillus sp. JJ1773 TaxID=3122965 RepID=UPI002FFF406C
MGLFNQKAEEVVVGSFFLKEGLVKECTLRTDHFHMKELQRLFAIVKRLNENGKPIDMISILEEMDGEILQALVYIGTSFKDLVFYTIFCIYKKCLTNYYYVIRYIV